MGKRGAHRLENLCPKAPPGLEFLFSSRVTLTDPLDIGSVAGCRRMIVKLLPGSTIEGPRMRGQILPGSVTSMMIRPDGVIDIDGLGIIGMDDGHIVSFRASGIRRISAETVHELAEGQEYDPALLYSRAALRFEAADDGPYAWLNQDLYVAKSVRTATGLDSTVWRLL